ncbi:TonB-dependent siderophore receptor [Pseudomonas capeferrum]|uniref:TonB-dependent receptor n=1 Tax=Pseudomonas capeferrum TaxID=1495066 RepID=UPI0015E28CB2|nr:TonB-dependent siderophore receptor [Pseudomonas capeferrum]MBA1203287.1 TonB-dependent siderophore receptor [Pseudomonas capeferrum]
MNNRNAPTCPARPYMFGALGLAVASISPCALAKDTGSLTLDLNEIHIDAEADNGYRAETSASRKYTAPLLDTPQTITVVPTQIIQEQQALSLRQVLSNVSGITFNAGEGGGGSGDSINIRGFSANGNMQIDGLRDSAQTTRSDTFNVDRVEVIKGPNSVFGGAGTTGGTINIISKQPQYQAFTRLGGSIGSDSYRRLTLDSNQPLEGVGHDSAVRLNLMAHQNDVAGRARIDRERWGVAPVMRLGLSESSRLTLSAFHQVDDNLPDYGVPALDGKRLQGVGRKDYFGWRNLDKEEVEQSTLTALFEHDFSDNLRLQNMTRYGRLDRDTVVSASHVSTEGLAPGRYRPAGPQAYGRDARTDLWINQTLVTASFDLLNLRHDLVTGLEVSRETLDLTTYGHGLRSSAYPSEGYDLSNPPGQWSGPASKSRSGSTSTALDNQALFVFDTLALHDQWDLNLGLRYDRFKGEAAVYSADRLRTSSLESTDEKLSGRVGIVFKPTDNGRFYAAWGNSFNPSAEALAGNGRGLSAATERLAPERNDTWELGAKWALLDQRLELDAAMFRVVKHNAREPMSDGSTQLAGVQRVQGVELGLTGHVTERWNLFATYTFLDSETLKAADTPAGIAREGQALANTPPRSFNLWQTYELPSGWTLGHGARYISARNVTSSTSAKLDAAWVHNAMLAYRVNEQMDLQLNINNLFDKEYVERVRQQNGTGARSSAIEYGDGRAAILTATYSF